MKQIYIFFKDPIMSYASVGQKLAKLNSIYLFFFQN